MQHHKQQKKHILGKKIFESKLYQTDRIKTGVEIPIFSIWLFYPPVPLIQLYTTRKQ